MSKAWLVLFLLPLAAQAQLTADKVVLLVNSAEPDSIKVAEHYLKLRGVPAENVFSIDLPVGETLSRKDYDEKLLPELRKWLADPAHNGKFACLLLVYGMPLRVGPRQPTAEEAAEAAKLKPELDAAKAGLKEAQERAKALNGKANRTAEEQTELDALGPKTSELDKQSRELDAKWSRATGRETNASLDSELALAAWPKYELYRWQFNILNFAFPQQARKQLPPVAFTARLDGPTPDIAMRLVTDAVAAETNGLKGKFYIDARGIKLNPDKPDWFGYAGYDESLRDLADIVKTHTKLEVVLDDKPELFGAGACTDAALYCGWYKLANYVDAFDWVPGAVAYHIASAEATTLRKADSNVWCKKMLEDGVDATLGPVNEPYTIGFPKPAEFFGALLTGKMTLVECYFATLHLNSWMTTLIGDPLYNPFKNFPQLTPSPEVLRRSPKGSPSLWDKPPGA